MYALYSAVMAAVLVAWLPAFVLRRRAGGYGTDLMQRLGRFEPGLPPPPRCWVHAVSVGEAATAAPLIEAVIARWPDLGVVVTTVTPTGARLVRERLGARVCHRYFPLDLAGPVRRALDAVRPAFFIGMETELWPNFLRALHRRGVPSMIANGRISDRSFRRYRLVRGLMAKALAHVSVFAMQSEEDARRIVALGAPPERVVVTGNLKSDLRPAAPPDPAWRERLALAAGDLLWVAGSTHRGEDEPVLDAWIALRARHPALRLVLAPRHPERAEEIEALAAARGLRSVRRTALAPGPPRDAVIVLDTVGELAQLYGWADLVFVGGSLVAAGGHNMLEPALWRKPALFGPHTENFRESARLLTDAGAAEVVHDVRSLEAAADRLLGDPAVRARMGEAALAAVTARQGAVSATLELIERTLAGGLRGAAAR
jgi:3-deoxy-D-manno-octulosonic-acid transferase